jgi:hypothetical protein
MTMSENNEIVVTKAPAGQLRDTQLATELGNTFGVPAQSIINLVRDQIIAVPRGEQPATPAELALVMSVMRQYRLNPMLKQVHAWRDWQGKMAIMVGYDGWVQYAREQPTYVGVSYEFGPLVDSPDGKGRKCWEWICATVHDKARHDIKMVPIYLEEWYVKQRKEKPEPWQLQTKHRLHLKAFTNAIREAYGLGGVVDEVDKDIMQQEYHRAEYATADKAQEMAEQLASPQPGESLRDVIPLVIDGRTDPVTVDEYDQEPAAVDESDMTPIPVLDAPCGFKGCSGMAVARCGECGECVCATHLGANGFSCAKHEGEANG